MSALAERLMRADDYVDRAVEVKLADRDDVSEAWHELIADPSLAFTELCNDIGIFPNESQEGRRARAERFLAGATALVEAHFEERIRKGWGMT